MLLTNNPQHPRIMNTTDTVVFLEARNFFFTCGMIENRSLKIQLFKVGMGDEIGIFAVYTGATIFC